MIQNDCPICHGRGIDPNTGQKCKCILENALIHFLPTNMRNIKIASDRKINSSWSEYNQLVITEPSNYPFINFLKHYLILKYLQDYTYKYHIMTGKDVFDVYMDSSIEAQSALVNDDLLVLNLGNDVKNKYMQELIPFLIKERNTKGLRTYVNIMNKGLYKNQEDKMYKMILDKYGEETKEVITNPEFKFKKVTPYYLKKGE